MAGSWIFTFIIDLLSSLFGISSNILVTGDVKKEEMMDIISLFDHDEIYLLVQKFVHCVAAANEYP